MLLAQAPWDFFWRAATELCQNSLAGGWKGRKQLGGALKNPFIIGSNSELSKVGVVERINGQWGSVGNFTLTYLIYRWIMTYDLWLMTDWSMLLPSILVPQTSISTSTPTWDFEHRAVFKTPRKHVFFQLLEVDTVARLTFELNIPVEFGGVSSWFTRLHIREWPIVGFHPFQKWRDVHGWRPPPNTVGGLEVGVFHSQKWAQNILTSISEVAERWSRLLKDDQNLAHIFLYIIYIYDIL